jgi:hypothetical protein
VLIYNLFEFKGGLYQQKIGSAMGTIAIIFMADLNRLVQDCAIKENLNYIHYYKRFIDNILTIWTGKEEQLKLFTTKVNLLHQSINFNCDYDIKNRSITYLDTTINLVTDEINTDLYRELTDRVR